MKTRNKLYDKSRLRLLCLLTALLGIFGAGQTWAGNPTTLTVGGTNALNGGYWLTNADGTLTDDQATKILAKMAKQRRETAEIYNSQNRPELAENELAEASVIEEYLPRQLSEE